MLGAAEAADPPPHSALLESSRRFAASWRAFRGLAKLMTWGADPAADDFLVSTRACFPTEERLLYRLVALHAAGRLAEADALDASLRQRDPEHLAQPPRALGLSCHAGRDHLGLRPNKPSRRFWPSCRKTALDLPQTSLRSRPRPTVIIGRDARRAMHPA